MAGRTTIPSPLANRRLLPLHYDEVVTPDELEHQVRLRDQLLENFQLLTGRRATGDTLVTPASVAEARQLYEAKAVHVDALENARTWLETGRKRRRLARSVPARASQPLATRSVRVEHSDVRHGAPSEARHVYFDESDISPSQDGVAAPHAHNLPGPHADGPQEEVDYEEDAMDEDGSPGYSPTPPRTSFSDTSSDSSGDSSHQAIIEGLSDQVSDLTQQVEVLTRAAANQSRFVDSTVQQMESAKRNLAVLQHEMVRVVGMLDDRRDSRRPPSPPAAPRRRAVSPDGVNLPPPKFLGTSTKGSLKINAWLVVFENWAQLRRLSSAQTALSASCCLDGDALNVYHDLKARMEADGLDSSSWPLLKAELVKHFAEVAPERTVRSRLSKLTQTSTVQAYHTSFRAICAEAVKHPIDGAEALFHFLEGLKPSLKQLCSVDPTTGGEWESLSKLVTYAKNIEPNADRIPAASAEPHPRCESRTYATVVSKGDRRRRFSAGAGPSSGPSTAAAPSAAPSMDAAAHHTVAPAIFSARVRAGRCGLCDSPDHRAPACPQAARNRQGQGSCTPMKVCGRFFSF